MTDKDIDALAAIDAVPKMLGVACEITGLGFAAVARVTEDRWVALAVEDRIDFGLKPGGELQVKTTICDEIRQSGKPVVVDHVDVDPLFRDHHTPKMYGIQSYISVPIVLRGGEFFGTLCAIDPNPAKVSEPATVKSFELFAELLALHLENSRRAKASNLALIDERRTAEMRDQFIAVLGHDLRNPLAALSAGTTALGRLELDGSARRVIGLMQESCKRMTHLTTDLLDFARGKLAGGVPLRRQDEQDLESVLSHVVDELRTVHADRAMEVEMKLGAAVHCDPERLAQLLSNLLGNALTHGDEDSPVQLRIESDGDVLTIEVANAGKVIPEEKLARLFHPFARAASGPEDGLGLGLYIASEIARAHGGTLSAVSTDEHTVFTARVPSRAEQLAEAAA